MTLTAIVAMTPSRVIGHNGDLPWHLPEDLNFFKRTTSGHPIIMGRKTYESIGKPLPNRRNIIITRNSDWSAEGVEVIHSPEDLNALTFDKPEVFIIGGAEIYSIFLPFLQSIIVSHVKEEHIGDTYFPMFTDEFPTSEVLEDFPKFVVKRHSRS